MRKVHLALAVILSAAPAAARAEPQNGGRELPIAQMRTADGAVRYAVWVKVGDLSAQAMIDTGSTGLRVLPSVFRREPYGPRSSVVFGGALQMEGVVTRAPLEIGPLAGTAPFQVVTDLGCTREKPDCEVERLGRDTALIGGDGFPSEGYSAILGIGFPRGSNDLPNPLQALGAKSWIVELPRPYASEPGRLVLDPDAATRATFTMLPRTRGSADADGCLRGAPLAEAVCGTVLFDTGAPVVAVNLGRPTQTPPWDAGTAGSLQFGDDETSVTMNFHVGESGAPTSVVVAPLPDTEIGPPVILAGVAPFLAYDVLYDVTARRVGLRVRPPAAPSPTVAASTR